MRVFFDSMSGPQRCKVIREVNGEYVILQPIAPPAGPFGMLEPRMTEFTALKSQCWQKARSISKFKTRFLLSERPNWAIS